MTSRCPVFHVSLSDRARTRTRWPTAFFSIAVVIAAATTAPVVAQTCVSPIPLISLPLGGATQGTSCGAGVIHPISPHPIVVHSFYGGPMLEGFFDFSAEFPDATLLLIDGRSGAGACQDGSGILGATIPGQSLDISHLQYGYYYLAVTSMDSSGQPDRCGDFSIIHWITEVDEIFVGSFENR